MMIWLELLGGWLVTSAIVSYLIGRWFRYQRDCDERDRSGDLGHNL